MNIWVTVGGYVAAAALGALWLDARDAVIEEREWCNTSKAEEVLEAEIAVADAQKAAHEREIQDMLEIVERARRAEAIARDAEELADSRPAKVRTIIERIADEDACISTVVPVDLVNGVFND